MLSDPRHPIGSSACFESFEARLLLSAGPQAGTDPDAPGPGAHAPAVTVSVRAAPAPDPRGDILPTYAGAVLPGMDVVAHKVTLAGERMIFFGRMAGRVEPTRAIGGLYLFGVNRGRGTPRFLGPASPPVIGPGVLWDSIVRVNPDGTGLFNNALAGVVTPLDPADIRIDGNHFTASVPLSLMLPGSTRPPEQWTYNLWPRDGIGRNVQVSDLAPDDGNAAVHVLSRNRGRAATTGPQGGVVVAGSGGVEPAGGLFSSFERIAET